MSALRVLVVHNRYQRPGGEDAVAQDEAALLGRHGHAVEVYTRHNDELERMSALPAAAQTLWSTRTTKEIGALAAAFRPDLIHAHNTFPLVSPSLYWAAGLAGIPVVQTLHNFRPLCVQAMFLRHDRVCDDCLGRIPWRGVVRRCYRDSAAHSAVLAASITLHRALGTLRDKVARYIALSEFSRDKFVAGGLPASKIAVKPNFAEVDAPPDGAERRGALYVGRLSDEKGVGVLRAALDLAPGVRLEAIGDGPAREALGARVLGWLPQREVYERMRCAAYLVMPSIWYEAFPRTLVEAFASGLPVIASRIGALAELVEHGRNGLLFEPGSPQALARSLAWAEAYPDKMRGMGERARADYEARFTPERNYRQLVGIYGDAIAACGLKFTTPALRATPPQGGGEEAGA